MSNDLEDFLKRAAQRRQANQLAQSKETPKSSPKPTAEYSDSRSERTIRIEPEDDESLMAEIVPDDHSRMPPPRKNNDRTIPSSPRPEIRNSQLGRQTQRRNSRTSESGRSDARSAKPTQSPIQTINPVGDMAPMTNTKMEAVGSRDDFYAVRSDANMGQLNVEMLIQTLKSPAGFRQAMLVREILERPTHRW